MKIIDKTNKKIQFIKKKTKQVITEMNTNL